MLFQAVAVQRSPEEDKKKVKTNVAVKAMETPTVGASNRLPPKVPKIPTISAGEVEDTHDQIETKPGEHADGVSVNTETYTENMGDVVGTPLAIGTTGNTVEYKSDTDITRFVWTRGIEPSLTMLGAGFNFVGNNKPDMPKQAESANEIKTTVKPEVVEATIETPAMESNFDKDIKNLALTAPSYDVFSDKYRKLADKHGIAIAGVPTEEMYLSEKKTASSQQELQTSKVGITAPESQDISSKVVEKSADLNIVKKGQSAAHVIKKRVQQVAEIDGLEMSDKEAGKIAWRIFLGENNYATNKKGEQRLLTTKRNIVHAGDVIQIGDNPKIQAQNDVIREYLYADGVEQKPATADTRTKFQKNLFNYLFTHIHKFSWGSVGKDPEERGKRLDVCSGFTGNVLRNFLPKYFGKVRMNSSLLQSRQLIGKMPNPDMESGYTVPGYSNLDFVKKGATVTVPTEDGREKDVKITKVHYEADGQTYFSAGKEKYVAKMLYDSEMGYYPVVGKASGWKKIYNNLNKKMSYYRSQYSQLEEAWKKSRKEYRRNYSAELPSEKQHEKDVKKYIEFKEAKTNDGNGARAVLRDAIPGLRASKGRMNFTIMGYNANPTNWRHAVIYTYVYNKSNPMKLNDGKFEVENSDIRTELNKTFANIPEDANISDVNVNRDGTMTVDFSWSRDHVRLRYDGDGRRTYQDGVEFHGRLAIDLEHSKAYYLEEARHDGGQDGPLQGAQFLTYDIEQEENGSFRLVMNDVFMIENTTSFDPTSVIQPDDESTIRAYQIHPEELEPTFSLSESELGKVSELMGVDYPELNRTENLAYGKGRYQKYYGIGKPWHTDYTHIVTGNLEPKGNFDYTAPVKEAIKGGLAETGGLPLAKPEDMGPGVRSMFDTGFNSEEDEHAHNTEE